jgi:hypothetical protein
MADEGSMSGACHCGTVRLRVKLSGGGLDSPRRCDCSYCRMRGAVVVSASVDDLEVVSGAEALALYQFNTNVAEHHFCSRCGIYTHHRRRSNPNQYGVNAAILEGVSPFDFAEVPVTDGVNHPSDGRSDGIIGTLRFIPSR